MIFQPHIYRPMTPRSSPLQTGAPAGKEKEQKVYHPSVVIPYGVQSTIGESTTPTTVVTTDTFVLHPSDCSFQRLLVSSSQTTTPTFLSVQLIQRVGQQVIELTQQRVYGTLTTQPVVIEDATPWAEGAVFLRLRATYSEALLFATVETLTSEVY